MSSASFESLPLSPELIENLTRVLGFTEMTPVQSACLPTALSGSDIIGQAKTGSGKTAVFALTALQKLSKKDFVPQALVLCPTRELANQVAAECQQFARGMANVKVLLLTGGAPVATQVRSLQHGAHVLVGTPGRIEDLINRRAIDFSAITTVVLDEADRMLDMGFEDTVKQIVASTPSTRQTLLFSATFAQAETHLAKQLMRDPQHLVVDEHHQQNAIQESFYEVTERQRVPATMALLGGYRAQSVLVFCSTREETKDLCQALLAAGHDALALHGDLQQRERDEALIRFSNGSANVLVATDVAARGLDIESLELVVNLRPARDEATYLHRIGRTGRAGNKGEAVTFFSPQEAAGLPQSAHTDSAVIIRGMAALEQANADGSKPLRASMKTIAINGGKKQKIRAGDLLGAMTRNGELKSKDIGQIIVNPTQSYVAVARNIAPTALLLLRSGKIKGRSYRVRIVS